jgi:hypothetical protein
MGCAKKLRVHTAAKSWKRISFKPPPPLPPPPPTPCQLSNYNRINY